jgi:hypothetical protein
MGLPSDEIEKYARSFIAMLLAIASRICSVMPGADVLSVSRTIWRTKEAISTAFSLMSVPLSAGMPARS